MTNLYELDAVALASLIRTRKISSRDATEDALARMDSVNPKLNAVVDPMREEALADADAADAETKRGDILPPLHGVPITVKINADLKGRATTNGIVAFKDNIAPEDSAVVRNLRRGGCIIIGRTNTPAFSMRWFTDNELHGRTLNPWDPKLTPGGSSGGASAATAAGVGAIGHGNDIGGSVRYPAYACGIFGIRPSFARVPGFNPSAPVERPTVAHQASVQGPLARSIRDLRVSLDVMALRDPRDPWQAPVPPVSQPHAGPVRVALFDQWEGCRADPEVARSLSQAAGWLADAGYQVEVAKPPHFEEVIELWHNLIISQENFDGLDRIEKLGDQALRNSFVGFAGLAKKLSAEDFIRGLAHRTTLLRAWTEFHETFPLLLMPSSWKMPFAIDTDQAADASPLLAAQTPQTVLPILGLPGLAVPILTDGEAPCGVQLSTARYGEAIALEAGEVIEARAPKIKVIDPRG